MKSKTYTPSPESSSGDDSKRPVRAPRRLRWVRRVPVPLERVFPNRGGCPRL
jgi:hypothetical protein